MKEKSQIKFLIDTIEERLASSINVKINQNLDELWGVCLFYLIVFQVKGKAKYLNQCILLFSKSLSLLIVGKNQSTALHDGLCGYYFLYLKLLKMQVIERNEKLDLFFNQKLKQSSSCYRLDLINGIIGNYLVTKDVKFIEYSVFLFDHFDKELNFLLDEPKKNFQTHSLNQKERYLLNTGFAHGWASKLYFIIAYIPLIQDDDIKIKMCKLAEGLYNRILLSEEGNNELSFPCYSNCTDNYSKRLGWCHNDLGIGYSILVYGLRTNNKSVVEKGISILKSTLVFNLESNMGVLDPFICHGSSGVALIYNRVYILTGDKNFKDKSDYWLNTCYSQFLNSKNNYNEISFLQGISGLGIAALYLEGKVIDTDWLELIQLSA
ncbi:MAG: hypothetical protein FGM41_03250 [Bacteroidetes bacterium]|nr:hypothetical protein [Bacteroidota bacterium]